MLDPQRRRALFEALGVSAGVTLAVTLASMFVPDSAVATVVGFVFLGATWLLVWRGSDARVEHAGLAFAGLVLPGPIDGKRVARDATAALAWALLFAAITFVPFYFGWRIYWHAQSNFSLTPKLTEVGRELFGQLVIIALPEEAFYRGYLQTRLDDAWEPRWRVLGATIGPSLFVGAIIFALGHLATIHAPARLAVFFPSLAFGWLRARTRGIGASVVFHALCNVFSEALGRGFGVY